MNLMEYYIFYTPAFLIIYYTYTSLFSKKIRSLKIKGRFELTFLHFASIVYFIGFFITNVSKCKGGHMISHQMLKGGVLYRNCSLKKLKSGIE